MSITVSKLVQTAPEDLKDPDLVCQDFLLNSTEPSDVVIIHFKTLITIIKPY